MQQGRTSIVYFGTPAFAVAPLAELRKCNFDIKGCDHST